MRISNVTVTLCSRRIARLRGTICDVFRARNMDAVKYGRVTFWTRCVDMARAAAPRVARKLISSVQFDNNFINLKHPKIK